MLTVDHYELIRRKVLIEGKSQRDTAKELGHSRNTVSKALELRISPGYRLSQPRPRPVIEPIKHIIDAWLASRKTPSWSTREGKPSGIRGLLCRTNCSECARLLSPRRGGESPGPCGVAIRTRISRSTSPRGHTGDADLPVQEWMRVCLGLRFCLAFYEVQVCHPPGLGGAGPRDSTVRYIAAAAVPGDSGSERSHGRATLAVRFR